MNEVWKEIPGYDGIYWVSNRGNIRSKNRVLKPSKHRDGYLHVTFSVKMKRKTFLVHRLVAIAFIPNPNNLPQINHKDEDKTNNCVENLEWCTMEYNIFYGTGQARSKIRGLPANTKAVCQYSLDGELIATYPSGMEAFRRTGISQASINNCCHHISHQMNGFVWRFEGDPFTPVPKPKLGKSVIQIDIHGNVIKVWRTVKDAAEYLGLKYNNCLIDCLKGRQSFCKGYKWIYYK